MMPTGALPKWWRANFLAIEFAAKFSATTRTPESPQVAAGDQNIGLDSKIWLQSKRQPNPSVNAKKLAGQPWAHNQTGPSDLDN